MAAFLKNTSKELSLTEFQHDDTPNILNAEITREALFNYFNSLFSGKTPENPENNLCSFISSPAPDAQLNVINIIKRIGSESSDGEVYLIESKVVDISVKTIYAALKVIPVINETSEDIFVTEMRINQICSKMVHDGQSIYFPLMYIAYKCNDIIFPQDDFLYLRAFKYKFLENINDNCIKIFVEVDLQYPRAREIQGVPTMPRKLDA
jgi:hypothetical protein